MKTRNTRIAGLAGAAMLVAGGITGAFAATAGQDDPAGDLASALSTRTGEQITSADVKGAFTDVLEERLREGVAAGRITQAQADEMLKRAQDSPLPGMGRGGPGPHHGRGMNGVAEAVAKTLGMTTDALHQAREQGMTMAQVAESKGVSRANLIATVTAAIEAGARGADLTDARTAQIATNIVDGKGGPGGGERGGPGGGAIRETLAKALGISNDALRSAVEAGTTPADVARAEGVDVATVVDAVAAVLKEHGPPSGAEPRTDATLEQMATNIVNGTGPRGNHPGGHMPPSGR